jgi:hypothetical protein
MALTESHRGPRRACRVTGRLWRIVPMHGDVAVARARAQPYPSAGPPRRRHEMRTFVNGEGGSP